jgi:LAS superfamily LD-carboxypeptidase LdcB
MSADVAAHGNAVMSENLQRAGWSVKQTGVAFAKTSHAESMDDDHIAVA